MTTEAGGSRGRVLLVADEGSTRRELGGFLEQQGYEVAAVADAPEALRRLSTYAPSLLLIDVDRPAGDGAELCRQVRQDVHQGFVPMLLSTGRPDTDDRVSAGLQAGADDVLFRPCAPVVLLARVHSHVQHYEAQVKLRQLVITDDLTGLFSRRFLFESMRHLAKQLSRGGPPMLSCLMIDVDHFKALNNERGPVEADRVLKAVAQTIRRHTRDSDIVARFGGEEFAVILPSTSGNGARITAEKIRRAVERETRPLAPVTVSVGVSWCELPVEVEAQALLKPEDVILNLLNKADAALLRAKNLGRNRVLSQDDPTAGEPAGGVPILLEVIDPVGRQTYYSTELSAAGLAVQQDEHIRDGDRLTLKLHLDDGVVDVLGEVVWSGPITGAGQQSCIKFVEVAGPVHDELERFLRGRPEEPR